MRCCINFHPFCTWIRTRWFAVNILALRIKECLPGVLVDRCIMMLCYYVTRYKLNVLSNLNFLSGKGSAGSTT